MQKQKSAARSENIDQLRVAHALVFMCRKLTCAPSIREGHSRAVVNVSATRLPRLGDLPLFAEI